MKFKNLTCCLFGTDLLRDRLGMIGGGGNRIILVMVVMDTGNNDMGVYKIQG